MTDLGCPIPGLSWNLNTKWVGGVIRARRNGPLGSLHLAVQPGDARFDEIPTVLLGRAEALFLSVNPSWASAFHITAWLIETPCSRNIQVRNSAIVTSPCCSVTRARSTS